MFPHADTLYTIQALDYEQKLRQAASERLAASAQVDRRQAVIVPASAGRVAAILCSGLLTRLRGTIRVRLSPQLTTGSVQRAPGVS